MKTYDTTHSLIKMIMVFTIIAVIALVGSRAYFIYRGIKSKETLYQVNVNNFQTMETYLTREYTRDEKSGCITFKDGFGIKRIVCNNYTITEY